MARYAAGIPAAAALSAMLGAVPVSHAEAVDGYDFAGAAQEIAQVFWLAETAQACGWTSDTDAARFKDFAVRFLGAHLSDSSRNALVSMVGEPGFEAQVRRVARDGAQKNCSSTRWHDGWVAYKSAADQHEQEY
jgi:hypothetical protein